MSLFILLSIGLGTFTGIQLPVINPDYVGPFQLQGYLRPYLFFIIPNLIFCGGLFFFMGSFFKKMVYVYLSTLFLFLLVTIADVWVYADIDNKMIGYMADISGAHAFTAVTKFWTEAEINSQLIPLTGPYLYNRFLWAGMGLIFLILSRVFYERAASRSNFKKSSPAEKTGS